MRLLSRMEIAPADPETLLATADALLVPIVKDAIARYAILKEQTDELLDSVKSVEPLHAKAEPLNARLLLLVRMRNYYAEIIRATPDDVYLAYLRTLKAPAAAPEAHPAIPIPATPCEALA